MHEKYKRSLTTVKLYSSSKGLQWNFCRRTEMNWQSTG